MKFHGGVYLKLKKLIKINFLLETLLKNQVLNQLHHVMLLLVAIYYLKLYLSYSKNKKLEKITKFILLILYKN